MTMKLIYETISKYKQANILNNLDLCTYDLQMLELL